MSAVMAFHIAWYAKSMVTLAEPEIGDDRLDIVAAQARLRTADGGEVAYVRVHFFASETTRAVQAALLAGEQDGVDGYVFDLRNNPGAFCFGSRTPVSNPDRETSPDPSNMQTISTLHLNPMTAVDTSSRACSAGRGRYSWALLHLTHGRRRLSLVGFLRPCIRVTHQECGLCMAAVSQRYGLQVEQAPLRTLLDRWLPLYSAQIFPHDTSVRWWRTQAVCLRRP